MQQSNRVKIGETFANSSIPQKERCHPYALDETAVVLRGSLDSPRSLARDNILAYVILGGARGAPPCVVNR